MSLDVPLLAFFWLLPVFFFSNCPGFQDLFVEGDRLPTRLIVQCQSGTTAFSADLRLPVACHGVVSLSNNCTLEIESRM